MHERSTTVRHGSLRCWVGRQLATVVQLDLMPAQRTIAAHLEISLRAKREVAPVIRAVGKVKALL